MDDLISRQAAIDECYPIMIEGEKFDVVQVETLIGLPTADVRENVRGEWVTPTEKVYSIDGEDITSAYKECNRCHKVYVRTNDNYCPNCGADMRGGKHGEIL